LSMHIDWQYEEIGEAEILESPDSSDAETGSTEPADVVPQIRPEEYAVYIAYLEKVIEFPKDLSKYERKVAIQEVKSGLRKRYNLTKSSLDCVMVKMRNRDDIAKN